MSLKLLKNCLFLNLPLLLPVGLIILAVLTATSYLSYRHFYQAEKPVTIVDEIKPAPIPPVIATATITTPQAVTLKVPILMYHYVEHVQDPKDTFRQKLDILPETLDAQVKDLQKAGYTFMFMSDVSAAIDNKQPLPTKPVVLTFDDGYRDFYTDVLPILKKNNVKATAYIITGFIGKPNYMFLPQLQEVQQSGLVEIGAHTVHHINLQTASVSLATAEIAGSKKELETMFHLPIETFAYPSGRFSAETIQIVQQAGFSTAVSTEPGEIASAANRYALFRLRPGSRRGPLLIQFLTNPSTKILSRKS